MFLEGPAIYLHTAEPPVACSPLPPDAELVAGVHARALDAEGDLGGAPPDPIRVVTFADLGVELRIVDGDQPTVVERIVESVRPADP